MERIYEFLNENDLGYRVYIGNENSIYMSYEDMVKYLELDNQQPSLTWNSRKGSTTIESNQVYTWQM